MPTAAMRISFTLCDSNNNPISPCSKCISCGNTTLYSYNQLLVKSTTGKKTYTVDLDINIICSGEGHPIDKNFTLVLQVHKNA